MSLKENVGCWMNDNPHGKLGAADTSRDEGVCDDQSRDRLVGTGERFSVWADRAGTESADVPAIEQRSKRYCERVPGQGDGAEPRPDDAPDPAVDGNAA